MKTASLFADLDFKENKPAFDPHELIVAVEIKEKEPENP